MPPKSGIWNRITEAPASSASQKYFAVPDRANQFDQFAPIHLARPVLDGAKSPAPESQFRERNQADWDFQSWPQNIAFR